MSPSTRVSALRHPSPPHIVGDPVEAFLHVHVPHHPLPFLDRPRRLAHRVLGVASRPNAMAVCGAGRVDHRLEDVQEALLDDPVAHGRNAPRAPPTPLFGISAARTGFGW